MPLLNLARKLVSNLPLISENLIIMRLLKSLRFAQNDIRFLVFGFLLTFASSFGQSYFIGVFGPAIRAEFLLSQSSWSAIYMLGTLASALILPITGQQIDKISLPYYSAIVIIFLSIASAIMALVPSAALLIFGIFVLRQSGQGLMSHTSFVAMARYFPSDRGKASAVASLGLSVGQALLPVAMLSSIALVGWRYSYGIISVSIIIFALPLALWLLKGHDLRHQSHQENIKKSENKNTRLKSWSRRQVLTDPRFYLLIPGVSAPSLIITALFFHNLSIADIKNWDATWFVANYWVYALGSFAAALATGPLIDRLTAVKVLPIFLMPMAIGLIIVWASHNDWWALPYLLFLGLTAGVTYTGLTALWAELYGVEHLGAIKALYSSIAIFASALGPLAMGIMLDLEISVEDTCLIFVFYTLFSTCLLITSIRQYRRD